MQEFFAIVGITITILLATVFIKKKNFKYLGLTFIFCSLMLFENYLWHSELIYSVPFFSEVFSPLSFFIPGLLLIHFIDNKLNRFYKIIFLIVPILPYVNFMPLYASSFEYKICYIKHEIYEGVTNGCQIHQSIFPVIISDSYLDYLLIFLFLLASILVFLKFRNDYRQFSKNRIGKKQKWSLLYILSIFMAFISTVVGIFFIPEQYSFKSYFIPTISIVICLYLLFYSEVFKLHSQSSNYSGLSVLEINSIYKAFLKFISEDEKYIKENLTLNSVSEELNISSNKLSFVIKKSNENFRNIINKKRIEKSIQLIQSDKYSIYSMDGISRMVGYKSKSTFYENFKKQIGMTPNEFKKRFDSTFSNS